MLCTRQRPSYGSTGSSVRVEMHTRPSTAPNDSITQDPDTCDITENEDTTEHRVVDLPAENPQAKEVTVPTNPLCDCCSTVCFWITVLIGMTVASMGIGLCFSASTSLGLLVLLIFIAIIVAGSFAYIDTRSQDIVTNLLPALVCTSVLHGGGSKKYIPDHS